MTLFHNKRGHVTVHPRRFGELFCLTKPTKDSSGKAFLRCLPWRKITEDSAGTIGTKKRRGLCGKWTCFLLQGQGVFWKWCHFLRGQVWKMKKITSVPSFLMRKIWGRKFLESTITITPAPPCHMKNMRNPWSTASWHFMTQFGGRGTKKHTWLPETYTFIKIVKAISLSQLQIMTYMKKMFHHFHPFKK